MQREAVLVLTLLLVACASGPRFETAGVNRELQPQAAVSQIDTWRGNRVIWGGVIVNATNVAAGTRIEILAYPLTNAQKPDREGQAIGRFLATTSQYLEPLDYTQGRLVTVTGTLDRTLSGQIGQAAYTYPVVAAERVFLWPVEGPVTATEPRFHIGIGVIFGG